MSDADERAAAKRRKGGEVRGDRRSALLGTLAGRAMQALAATLRLEVREECGLKDAADPLPPAIYLLWHSRFFAVPAAWRRLAVANRRVVALTSASHDGDMVARAVAVFGLGAVRGSSSRRSVAALVGMRRALRDGFDVCVTPDGPRGPRYRLQAGAIKLAESTGAPLVPVHVRFFNAWRLKTWDRFVIPKPFSRVEVVFAGPIRIPPGLDEAAFEGERARVERILLEGADDV